MNRKKRRSRSGGAKAPDAQTVNQLVSLCRARRFAEAFPHAREFTRQWPMHAVGWHALAACAQAAGRTDEAIRAHRKALAIEPGNADAHNNLGLLLAEAGQPADAETEYRRAVRLRPRFVHAWFNLGLLLSGLDRVEEAVECFRSVLEIEPGFAAAHNALGNISHRAGDLEGALEQYRAAVRAQPASAEFHAGLANALRDAGHDDEAEAEYREALTLQPEHVQVRSDLGLFLARTHRDDEAEACFREALAIDPNAADVHVNLGNLLRHIGQDVEAESCYRRATELANDWGSAWNALAELLMESGRIDEGLDCQRRARDRAPVNVGSERALGNALAIAGRRDGAIEAYLRALEIDPLDGESWYRLSQVQMFAEDDSAIETLAALAESPDGSTQSRMYALYALGKALADANRSPEDVIDCFRRAGICWQEIHGDIAGQEIEALDAICRYHDPDTMQRLAGSGLDTEQPIFIVGMPRSGTTLVEQILTSHPAVHGAGERFDLERAVEAAASRVERPFPACVEAFTAAHVGEIAETYRRGVLDAWPERKRVTDKMPDNFRFIGLVALALPHARIVHIARDPVDTCLSCFERPFFGKYAASHDLASLGRYYRSYANLMDHWRDLLPTDRLLELRYEDLVTEPEPHIRELLTHCGLPWDDRCMQFHETRRAVVTASLGQVRKPLYRDSIGRWKRYRESLSPLLDALGSLAPSGVSKDST